VIKAPLTPFQVFLRYVEGRRPGNFLFCRQINFFRCGRPMLESIHARLNRHALCGRPGGVTCSWAPAMNGANWPGGPRPRGRSTTFTSRAAWLLNLLCGTLATWDICRSTRCTTSPLEKIKGAVGDTFTAGKLGQYMVQHASSRGYAVVGVCRERSVGKLDGFKGRITVPAKYRGRLAGGLVVTKGIDPSLWLFPADTWEELAGKSRLCPHRPQGPRVSAPGLCQCSRLGAGQTGACDPAPIPAGVCAP
jgi:hypothetical protein